MATKATDPTGLYTFDERLDRLQWCLDDAEDEFQTCLKDAGDRWRDQILCGLQLGNRETICRTAFELCIAASEEGLYCLGTAVVVTGAAVVSQLDTPLPGPADAVAAGVLGWWFGSSALPEDDGT